LPRLVARVIREIGEFGFSLAARHDDASLDGIDLGLLVAAARGSHA
jgi:hypothetical protein